MTEQERIDRKFHVYWMYIPGALLMLSIADSRRCWPDELREASEGGAIVEGIWRN